MRRPVLAAALCCAALGCSLASPRRSLAADAPPGVAEAIRTLGDPTSPEDAQDAARLLAAAGADALPAVREALARGSWFANAALVAAVGEMECDAAGPLLAGAAGDRSFAVREAAVRGLGKIGGPDDAPRILDLADARREPVWRVRSAAAEALRRAVLRGVLPRAAGEAALARLLLDSDPDTRRAALRACVPLGAADALPALLELYDDRSATPGDRALALAALRAYRERSELVLPALRRGLVESDDPAAAAAAGAALLDLGGAAELQAEETSRAVVRQLGDVGAPELRMALSRRGPDAIPWLTTQIEAVARRIAQRRVEHAESPLEVLVEALVEVRRDAAADVLRDLCVGPEAEVLPPATRRFALRKVQLLFAERFAADLRRAYDAPGGEGIRRELLLAIEASGGDDIAARLTAALEGDDASGRWAALELLRARPDLPTTPALRALAAAPATGETMRRYALEALVRRDPAGAADVARELLAHDDAAVRRVAAELLATAGRPEDADALAARLAAEDGVSAAARAAANDPDAAITPSSADSTADRRRRARRSLLTALRACDAARARAVLLDELRNEKDPLLRGNIVVLLRGAVRDEDGALLLAALAEESEPDTRGALLATLATLGGSEPVRTYFEKLVADPSQRGGALERLRVEDARVVPHGIEEGLDAPGWSDDERVAVLTVLAREKRVPPPEKLIEIALAPHARELTSEALRLVAATGGERAGPLLAGLLESIPDPERLAVAAEQLGRLRFEPAVPALAALLPRMRPAALAAASRSDPGVEAYRRCAVALGRCGTDEAGRALVAELLDPAVARAVSLYSVPADGPFHPRTAPAVAALRALVAGFAHLEEPRCTRLIHDALAERRAQPGAPVLPEEYLDGVVRYLRDPEAFALPARRRPASALPLAQLVLRTAPRLSPLDVDMQRFLAEEFEAERRYDEAVAAQRAAIALADVEEGWRTPERRLDERGKLTLLEALRDAGSAGRDAALARLAALRTPDPGNGNLAYLDGSGRARLGVRDEAAREALRLAVTVDEGHTRAHLWLGWVTEGIDGPPAALGPYAEALRLDRKSVLDSASEIRRDRNGAVHRWSTYPFWYARALARCGEGEEARSLLREAILRDDRAAGDALAESAFAGWPDLRDVVGAALAAVPDSD